MSKDEGNQTFSDLVQKIFPIKIVKLSAEDSENSQKLIQLFEHLFFINARLNYVLDINEAYLSKHEIANKLFVFFQVAARDMLDKAILEIDKLFNSNDKIVKFDFIKRFKKAEKKVKFEVIIDGIKYDETVTVKHFSLDFDKQNSLD